MGYHGTQQSSALRNTHPKLEGISALSKMHSPACLGTQAAWGCFQMTVLSLRQCFSNYFDYKNHLEHLLQTQVSGLSKFYRSGESPDSQGEHGICIINKRQSDRYDPRSTLGKNACPQGQE